MSKNHVPVVGEKLFIMSACGTETPYTVEAVNEKGTRERGASAPGGKSQEK